MAQSENACFNTKEPGSTKMTPDTMHHSSFNLVMSDTGHITLTNYYKIHFTYQNICSTQKFPVRQICIVQPKRLQLNKIWWRHQIETFSVLLALCEWNPQASGGVPSQRPMTRKFDVFFDLNPNKRLIKQPSRRWFETPSRSLWRRCHETAPTACIVRRCNHPFILSEWFSPFSVKTF